MKITKAQLKKIILEELSEVSGVDTAPLGAEYTPMMPPKEPAIAATVSSIINGLRSGKLSAEGEPQAVGLGRTLTPLAVGAWAEPEFPNFLVASSSSWAAPASQACWSHPICETSGFSLSPLLAADGGCSCGRNCVPSIRLRHWPQIAPLPDCLCSSLAEE